MFVILAVPAASFPLELKAMVFYNVLFCFYFKYF